MSRSKKDRANHFLHHKISQYPYAKKTAKHKYTKEDVPSDVKELVNMLEQNGKGNRHGNNRNFYAKMKLVERKEQRLKTKDELKQEIRDMSEE